MRPDHRQNPIGRPTSSPSCRRQLTPSGRSSSSITPHAKSGDLSPGRTTAFDDAASEAVEEWIQNKIPACSTAHQSATHTPGPWLTDEEGSVFVGGVAITNGKGKTIAHLEHWSEDAPEEATANGRLRAAAPKLLDALDCLLKQTVDKDLAYGIELTEGEREARDKALFAIGSANGNT
jgi:hypothetical protein